MKPYFTLILFIGILSLSTLFCVFAKAEEVDGTKLNSEINDQVGTKTDSNAVEREEDEISPERLTSKQKEQFKSSSASHQYQAEVNQLMNIIINSLYSNTDVFLRELISNASDALDKIRFISLSDKKALEGKPELEIRIKVDAKNKMIHIVDSGIGMTKEELIKNLGTIAKSGTKDFINKLKETKADASNLIGQFGVGFYSSFLVADKVTVISKHYNSDKQYIWESDAGQNFNVAEDPRGNTLVRGTQITLHIKDEHKELLDTEKIETLLRRFSEFIEFPIYIWKSFQETEEIPLTEEEISKIKLERKEKREKEKQEKKSEEEVELGKDETQDKQDEEEDEKDLPKTRTEKKTVYRYEQVNTNKPIWTREKSSITESEYKAFYKAITKDSEDPVTYTHFNAEGSVNFKSILYIPKSPPSNMFDINFKKDGLKLYVRRVFITDDFFDVLPTWLAFLKGVIDSEDMQLNVSREILQQTKSLSVLKKKVVRKAIAMMQSMAKNETSYTEFWENYSKPIKYGVLQDPSNQIRLAKLLRFSSSHNTTAGTYTSLTDYVSRMKKNQTSILYLAGDNIDKLQQSPLAESALEKGYEILYMNDAIDEYVVQGLRTFDAKYKFSNLQKEDVKLDEDKDEEKKEAEKKRQEALDEQYKELKDFLKEKLSAKISKVTLSERLTKSPAALVASTYGLSANMERIMKAQALGTAAPSRSFPTMEVNPNHPIIVELNNRLAVEGKDSPVLANSVEILFHTSALVSGYPVDDPGYFANSIHSLLNNVLGVKSTTSTPTPAPTEAKHDEL